MTNEHTTHERGADRGADRGHEKADHDRPEKSADPKSAADPIMQGLKDIDAAIVKSSGGPPGSGILELLDMLAAQFFGVHRPAPESIPLGGVQTPQGTQAPHSGITTAAPTTAATSAPTALKTGGGG